LDVAVVLGSQGKAPVAQSAPANSTTTIIVQEYRLDRNLEYGTARKNFSASPHYFRGATPTPPPPPVFPCPRPIHTHPSTTHTSTQSPTAHPHRETAPVHVPNRLYLIYAWCLGTCSCPDTPFPKQVHQQRGDKHQCVRQVHQGQRSAGWKGHGKWRRGGSQGTGETTEKGEAGRPCQPRRCDGADSNTCQPLEQSTYGQYQLRVHLAWGLWRATSMQHNASKPGCRFRS
jgi:hypothetical protein